jgi:hypothetical protein
MRGERRVGTLVALVLVVTLAGACSSDGSSKAKSRGQRAARARAIAVRRAHRAQRRQTALRRATAPRRRARAGAARHRAQQARLTRLQRKRATNPTRDLVAVRRSVQHLNAAFDAGIVRGIVRSVALNYWVVTGVYDAADCAAFEAGAGDGIVEERLVVHPETFRSAPGWVDPATGLVPRGRIYAVGVDEIQTLVPTGAQRQLPHDLHASVDRTGRALLFFRCA